MESLAVREAFICPHPPIRDITPPKGARTLLVILAAKPFSRRSATWAPQHIPPADAVAFLGQRGGK
jgi:hypothetical protein